MKRKQNKIILGSVFGLAALAVAIDYTRHSLPKAEPQQHRNAGSGASGSPDSSGSIDAYLRSLDNLVAPCSLDAPCSMDDNPCSLDDSVAPCSLEDNPCSLDDLTAPCAIDDNPCSLGDADAPCGLD